MSLVLDQVFHLYEGRLAPSFNMDQLNFKLFFFLFLVVSWLLTFFLIILLFISNQLLLVSLNEAHASVNKEEFYFSNQ
jgi:hypothetical protein